MVNFQELAYRESQQQQYQEGWFVFSNLQISSIWDIAGADIEDIDIDSLETIDKYNLRRAGEIKTENEQERRNKRADLFHDRRKEALKAFKEWNGAMAGGVNVKPICTLCDKTVDYLTCRPIFYSLHNPQSWVLPHKLALKSISYVAYCHGEQQSFIAVPEGFKNWQGFALTTAFNFRGNK